jgi:beta,beta-carotene 9',10'-dioxygenase
MGKDAFYSEGFSSVDKEVQVDELPVRGEIPLWLKGTLIRTTPALYRLPKQQLSHWFDGFALLHKFQIQNRGIGYRSRFLKSEAYQEAMETGQLERSEFATDPCRSIFGKISSFFRGAKPTDNGNANIIKLGGELAAVTETPYQNVFDERDLSTKGHFKYGDDLKGALTVTHPHYDHHGNLISYLLKFGVPSTYTVYQQAPGSHSREIIGVVKTDRPSYMHSFGMTERYVILVEFPLIVNPLHMRFYDRPFIRKYHWDAEEVTRFHIIDRYTGEHLGSPCSEACFSFHHVNAFEKGHKIYVDMVVYPDASIIEELYLNNLRSDDHTIATAHLLRVELDFRRERITSESMLSDAAIELPRIHPEHHHKPYRYCYGASNQIPGDFIDSIVKIDISDGSYNIWQETQIYPGEPVFVPAPHGEAEDDGLLLSVVFDAAEHRSFLLILDATDLKEIARAEAPQYIPFGFHGEFFR